MARRKGAKCPTDDVLCMLEEDSGANIYPGDSSSVDKDLHTHLQRNYGSGESDPDYIPLERYVVCFVMDNLLNLY